MIITEPGHLYLLQHLESPGREVLRFIRRSSAAIDYGAGEHPGTNSQEVIRALIDRTIYLDKILGADETLDAVYYLRMALFCYEARALRRKQNKLNKTDKKNYSIEKYKDIPFSEYLIEYRSTGNDGHIIL